MAKIYDLNEAAVLSVEFRDKNGNLADPDVVMLLWTDPANEATTRVYAGGTDPDIVRDSLGKFHGTIVGTLPGPWAYRWIAQGGVDDEKEGFFVVKIPRIMGVTAAPSSGATTQPGQIVQTVRYSDLVDVTSQIPGQTIPVWAMEFADLLPVGALVKAVKWNVKSAFGGAGDIVDSASLTYADFPDRGDGVGEASLPLVLAAGRLNKSFHYNVTAPFDANTDMNNPSTGGIQTGYDPSTPFAADVIGSATRLAFPNDIIDNAPPPQKMQAINRLGGGIVPTQGAIDVTITTAPACRSPMVFSGSVAVESPISAPTDLTLLETAQVTIETPYSPIQIPTTPKALWMSVQTDGAELTRGEVEVTIYYDLLP